MLQVQGSEGKADEKVLKADPILKPDEENEKGRRDDVLIQFNKIVVLAAGFEPATSSFGGKHSIHLSYASVLVL